MRTDVKIGLVCAFVIVMGAVIYFVAQPSHPAKPHSSDATAANSGGTPEPSTAPATAPSLASGGSVGGPFILPPGPSEPVAGTPAGLPAEPAGSLTSGGTATPFGVPSMTGSPSTSTLGAAVGGLSGGTAGTFAAASPSASAGTFGASSSGSAASGTHAGTIDLSGTAPLGGLSAGSPSFGPSSAASTYVIQKDDMLGPIAKHFNVSVSAIIAANPGLNPNRLQVKQTINIPANSAVAAGTGTTTAPSHTTHDATPRSATHTGVAVAVAGAAKPGNSYKVKKSDTLMTIARSAYGSEKDWKRIYRANEKEISDPNLVPVGLVIKIPQ